MYQLLSACIHFIARIWNPILTISHLYFEVNFGARSMKLATDTKHKHRHTKKKMYPNGWPITTNFRYHHWCSFCLFIYFFFFFCCCSIFPPFFFLVNLSLHLWHQYQHIYFPSIKEKGEGKGREDKQKKKKNQNCLYIKK